MFLKWNDALAAHFFRHEMMGRPVYLYTTEELIGQLGSSLGSSLEGLVETLNGGPPWATRQGICMKAYQAFDGWRARGLPYPPYIGYLALFVLAAGMGSDFSPHAYYPRLRRLLDEEEGSTLPSFDKMLELWDDLEQWSGQDRRGELGLFRARIVGGWIHVGLPIAQTLLTEAERAFLPDIFFRASLDPSSPPPDPELARLLCEHGSDLLRPRTIDFLRSPLKDGDLFEVLLETIGEELEDWEGQESELPSSPRRARCFGALRLCMKMDRVAGTAQLSLRCRINKEFPEDGLALISADGSEFLCQESHPGWSSPLQNAPDGRPMDASWLDWAKGFVAKEKSLGWWLKLPGRLARILVNGGVEGLPGLVEVYELPRKAPFYLLFHDSVWSKLDEWASKDCIGFADIPIREGLPHGWRLISLKRAENDARVRDAFPLLAFSNRIRLRLKGGLRNSVGNSFFAFAPPDLRLEGGNGTEEVWCYGKHLSSIAREASTYSLPAGLPKDERVTIEVRRGEKVLRRHSLHLARDFDLQASGSVQRFDHLGLPCCTSEASGLAGALQSGQTLDTSSFKLPTLEESGLLAAAEGRVFLVGKAPGQIACAPAEQLPRDWSPIWAIPMSRQGHAIYCGALLEESFPLSTHQGSREQIALWQEVIWHWRKKISPPEHKSLSALWKLYQGVARNA